MYLPEVKDYGNYWACDIEADSLLPTVAHCAVAIRVSDPTEVRRMVGHGQMAQFFNEEKAKGRKFVFHNGIGYDAPNLNKLCGTKLTIGDLVDTMLMSMVFSPSLEGGHSLESWGVRLRFPKTEFSAFETYTPEMLKYCENDTELCRRTFLALIARMKQTGFSNLGLEIEHRSWQLIQVQKKNGFAFNLPEAHTLLSIVRAKETELEQEIHRKWPPTLQFIRHYKQARKKDGSWTKGYDTHLTQYEKIELSNDGGYNAYNYVAFSIGSPQQRVEKLLEAGWVPREYTKPSKTHPQGQPQATVKGQLSPSLLEFIENGGPEEARLIAQWIDYNSRGNTINTWIEAYNHDTGCIHGSLWLANTLRYKHSDPNTANIPAVRVFKVDDVEQPLLLEKGVYTYEARNLWTVRDRTRRVLVGVDAKGIQLRVLAHYLKNKEFTDAVIGGDPHSYNQEIGGFGTRAIAKTFIYAFLLGAGDAKVGQIIGGTAKEGKQVKEQFIGNFPGLGELLDNLERQIKRTGRIMLCDGTPIIVTKPHTRLGYLLQGDESRIMKQAAILTDRETRRRGLDILKVGDIHDEWQNDALSEHAEEFAFSVCPDAFSRTRDTFRYSVPLECDARIGMTWAETH